MIAILDGSTDETVSVFGSPVLCVDVEDHTGCWFRKRRAKVGSRRSYSLVEPPKDIKNERWNQSGFDSRPATPPLSENRQTRDEVKTFSPLDRRLRLKLDSSILK
jgi:hypothetical protein